MIKKLSVITPFLNEEDNVQKLCQVLDKYAEDKPYEMELVFVDDGSTDNSDALFEDFDFSHARAKLIKLSKNFGSHAAIRAGIQNATADICVFFSADLQEPVEIIGQMLDQLEQGFDYVCARKRSSRTSALERFFSLFYSRLIKKFAVRNFPLRGVNNIMFNQKIKDNLNKHVERNSSIFLQIIDMGYRMSVIDVDYLERTKGRSKWTLGKRIKLLIDSFVSFSFFPIRLVSIAGVLMFIIGLAVALAIVVIKVFDLATLALGWPTLISIISIGFGITNISIGILAEYLWRNLDYSRNSAPFIVDEVIDITKGDGDRR